MCPADWNAYFRVCPACKEKYHASEGGCNRCDLLVEHWLDTSDLCDAEIEELRSTTVPERVYTSGDKSVEIREDAIGDVYVVVEIGHNVTTHVMETWQDAKQEADRLRQLLWP